MKTGENQVRVEKLFRVPAPELFRAIAKGRLLFNCSGDQETFENDFRVGGRYRARVPSYNVDMTGQYLEIVQDRKIAFTWLVPGEDSSTPETQVTIELFPEGNSTRLVLVHTGFLDRETTESHNGGWTGGIADLASEIENGQIRMVRVFKVSREKLYAACSNPAVFFGIVSDVHKGSCDFRVGGRYSFPTAKGGAIEGRFEEIVPNKRLVFTWEKACSGEIPGGSRVELRFDDEEDGTSSLELIHSGLKTDENVESHRAGWNYVMNQLPAKLQ